MIESGETEPTWVLDSEEQARSGMRDGDRLARRAVVPWEEVKL